MMSNIDPFYNKAKAFILALFVLVIAHACALAQKQVVFGFDFEGKHHVSSVDVDVYYGFARKSIINSRVVEVEDKVESMVLAFHGFQTKDEMMEKGVALIIHPSFLTVTGNLRAEQIGIQLRPGAKPRLACQRGRPRCGPPSLV